MKCCFCEETLDEICGCDGCHAEFEEAQDVICVSEKGYQYHWHFCNNECFKGFEESNKAKYVVKETEVEL